MCQNIGTSVHRYCRCSVSKVMRKSKVVQWIWNFLSIMGHTIQDMHFIGWTQSLVVHSYSIYLCVLYYFEFIQYNLRHPFYGKDLNHQTLSSSNEMHVLYSMPLDAQKISESLDHFWLCHNLAHWTPTMSVNRCANILAHQNKNKFQ
jgi:hypothetical protein